MNMPNSAATQCNCNKTHCNLQNGQQTPLQLTKWKQWTWTTALQHSATATKHTATYTMETMNMTYSAAAQCNCNKTPCNLQTMNMPNSAATQCNCNKTHCNLHNGNHEHDLQRCNTVQLQQNTLQLTQWKPWTCPTALQHSATATKHTATYKTETMNMPNSAATQCNCNKTHCNLQNGNHGHAQQRCNTVQLQQNTLQLTKWNPWTWPTALQHSATATKHTATYTTESMDMNDSATAQCNSNKTHRNLHNGTHEHDLQRCNCNQTRCNLHNGNHEHDQQRCNTVHLQQNTLQLTQWKPWTWPTAILQCQW